MKARYPQQTVINLAFCMIFDRIRRGGYQPPLHSLPEHLGKRNFFDQNKRRRPWAVPAALQESFLLVKALEKSNQTQKFTNMHCTQRPPCVKGAVARTA